MPSRIDPPSASFTVKPLPLEEGKKANFGVIVEGLDLNNISGSYLMHGFKFVTNYVHSDADVNELKKTIWDKKVIIVKGQKDLLPIKQWELVTRFDPDAPQVHSHGTVKSFNKHGGILSVGCTHILLPSPLRLVCPC